MSFWSGSKLRTAFPVQSIVEPFDPSNIDCAAYTLTVGPEYFITPSFDTKQADSVRKVLAAGEKSSGVQTVGGGTLAIPPGQFAFLVTEEKLSIPTNVIGFISLKSKIKWSGLINVSGFHVDPGFSGRLVYSVFNAGPSPIHLDRGQKAFLLWIADLDPSSLEADSRKGISPQESISTELISKVDRPVHSLQSLSDKIEELSTELTIFKRLVAIIASVAAVLIALTALGFTIWRTLSEISNKIS